MGRDNRPVAVRLMARSARNEITGCLEWSGYTNNGYGFIRDNWRRIRTHIVAYRTFVGAIPKGMLVCHRCDNRKCIEPSHLFLGTHQDNQADKVAKGRQAKGQNHGLRGEAHPLCRLSSATVAEIRKRYLAKEATQYQLAEDYGVTQSYISQIIKNKRWKEQSWQA